MASITAFSARDITTRERLEDYALHELVNTAGGVNLQVALVCDGAGGGEEGELAAKLTARTVLEYLNISKETNIPKLLVKAVEEANRVVYSEFNAAASSTLALAAINLDEEPNGRMFIASVGNSVIYLMRNGQIARLNTDHTIANERVIAGQITPSEVERVADGHQLMRSIGSDSTVNVDIGFYAESGRDFVPAERAFQFGLQGLLLEEGDTIIVATDGLFEVSKDEQQPYLREAELLRHALDDDVERATKSMLRYAADRKPQDNIALAVVFVPSSRRKAVRTFAKLSPRARFAIAIASALLLLIIAVLGVALLGSFQRVNDTQAAAAAAAGTQQAQLDSLYATSTALAAVPIEARNPTITYLLPDQVGFQIFKTLSDVPIPLFEQSVPSSPEINYLTIAGKENDTHPRAEVVPGLIFLQPNTLLRLDLVDNTQAQERIELQLFPNGDLFTETRDFANGGVQVSVQQNAGIFFEARTLCMAAKQIPPDPAVLDDTQKVAFTCYTGTLGDCTITINGQTTSITPRRRVLVDIDRAEILSEGPILFTEAQTYLVTTTDLLGRPPACITQALAANENDIDGDGFLNEVDACPDRGDEGFGIDDNGCPNSPPDSDDDGVSDALDQCPQQGDLGDGLLPNGCPIIDSDDDGIPDTDDACPAVGDSGDGVDEEGCPLGIADADGDGIADDVDVCPGARDDVDTDGDGIPNGCDDDDDGDGVLDGIDLCPFSGDTAGSRVDINGCPILDSDNDGVPNSADICPGFDDLVDEDLDGIPDGCDDLVGSTDPQGDLDGDGVPNSLDQCPGFDDNLDSDGDGIPNGCDDNDADNDGFADSVDNCPNDPGTNQGCPDGDTDNDGVPDSTDNCDTQPGPPPPAGDGCPVAPPGDADNDGIPDGTDVCANTPANELPVNQSGARAGCPRDTDGDMVIDATDQCDNIDGDAANNGCPNLDGDALADANDNPATAIDLCPALVGPANQNGCPTSGGTDDDGDGIPNVYDPDDDNDSVPDSADVCPGLDDLANPNGTSDNDDDNDGIPDICDPDVTSQADFDGDGVANASDACPGYDDAADSDGDSTPDGCEVDADNDGVLDIYDSDDDGDGVADAADVCPGFDDHIDTDGDGLPNGCDTDSDGDGTPDGTDACDYVSGAVCAGDSDGDTVNDDIDQCPSISGTVGNNGCPTNTDADGDGVADAIDQCPGQNDGIDDDADTIPDCIDPFIPFDQDFDGYPIGFDLCPNSDPFWVSNGFIDGTGCSPFDIRDSDFDGTPDVQDPDDDNDGVQDNVDQCAFGNDNRDTDRDGLADDCDPDDDNDSVSDFADFCPGGNDLQDNDLDGIPDDCDVDDDNDGVPDESFDINGGGVIDPADICAAGDDNIDGDDDGVPDACETVAAQTCAGGATGGFLGPDGQAPNDFCDPDDDNDGLVDLIDPDDDNDCISDADEVTGGSNPLNTLDPNDPPNTCMPALMGAPSGSSLQSVEPTPIPDSDNDGVPDEFDMCGNFPDSQDTDTDGIPDACDLDDDNDFINDEFDACPLRSGEGFGVGADGCPNGAPPPAQPPVQATEPPKEEETPSPTQQALPEPTKRASGDDDN